MTDRDKNRDETAPNDELPGDEELDEESGQAYETADEGPEGEAEFEGSTGAAPSGERRRFGFGRGSHDEEEVDKRQIGSVRGTHERVHIDDRASALFALVCAALLLAVLIVPMVAGALPQPAGPKLTPLVVPTGQAPASLIASPSASAAASVSIAPSASPAPTASTSPAPSASTK
jgi:hypothetical protein